MRWTTCNAPRWRVDLEATRIERFQIFLAAALIALTGAELIPDRVTQGFGRKWNLRRKQTATLASEVN